MATTIRTVNKEELGVVIPTDGRDVNTPLAAVAGNAVVPKAITLEEAVAEVDKNLHSISRGAQSQPRILYFITDEEGDWFFKNAPSSTARRRLRVLDVVIDGSAHKPQYLDTIGRDHIDGAVAELIKDIVTQTDDNLKKYLADGTVSPITVKKQMQKNRQIRAILMISLNQSAGPRDRAVILGQYLKALEMYRVVPSKGRVAKSSRVPPVMISIYNADQLSPKVYNGLLRNLCGLRSYKGYEPPIIMTGRDIRKDPQYDAMIDKRTLFLRLERKAEESQY